MDNLFDDLEWRGLVYQVTDRERARTALQSGAGLRAYIGFDPTATSLHVGSLLPITLLMRLQRAGHHPIAVVGGGTGLIGDPSGKSAERKLLDAQSAQAQARAIGQQLSHFLDRGEGAWQLVDNLDWLGEAKLLDFLRDIGKHFSVNAMVQRDSVRTRLDTRDQGISFTEFSYMLLQAYDFLELFQRHGCRAQLGGSDQWGNIVSGVDLIDRIAPHAEDQAPFGLTVPLITTKSGQKFGKTEAGAVWLDAGLTSAYQFFQFWINTDDEDAAKYLRFFTFLDRATIEGLEAEHAPAPHTRVLQKRLARELTTLVHGENACVQAEMAATVLFGGDPRLASAETFAMLASELPGQRHAAVATVQQILVGDAEGFAFKSNGEAKRALQAGSVTVNGEKLGPDLQAPLAHATLLHGRWALVRVGKKTYYLAQFG
jgi:tyrosyl-tRNA synthetase